MRSGSRHRGEAGGGWSFPPLLATGGRIHKGDCEMTGAIFARGSCRALKWMALLGVVFTFGVGQAAAQVATADMITVKPASVDVAEGGSATFTVGLDGTLGEGASIAVMVATTLDAEPDNADFRVNSLELPATAGTVQSGGLDWTVATFTGPVDDGDSETFLTSTPTPVLITLTGAPPVFLDTD